MPLIVMEQLDRFTSSYSGSESSSPQNWDGEQSGGRTNQRRQRNRDAARKSRKKQTERADLLHEELQNLERANATFVKEIADLKKELQRYTTALKEHESHCALPCWPESEMPVTGYIPSTSTSNVIQNSNLNSNEEQPFLPVLDPPAQEISLADLLDRTDWLTWEPVDL